MKWMKKSLRTAIPKNPGNLLDGLNEGTGCLCLESLSTTICPCSLELQAGSRSPLHLADEEVLVRHKAACSGDIVPFALSRYGPIP